MVTVYIVDGARFNKVRAKNDFGRITFVNDSNRNLKQFQPPQGQTQFNNNSQNIVYNPIIQPPPQPYNQLGAQQTSMNTNFGGNMLTQTPEIRRNTMSTDTNFRFTQTPKVERNMMGTSINKVHQDPV